MTDFFDQDTGNDFDSDVPSTDRPTDGPTILVNGSYQSLEIGAPLRETCQRVALQAGFGKFRVFLNGQEIRPKAIQEGRVPSEIASDMNLEIRPFDEAG